MKHDFSKQTLQLKDGSHICGICLIDTNTYYLEFCYFLDNTIEPLTQFRILKLNQLSSFIPIQGQNTGFFIPHFFVY